MNIKTPEPTDLPMLQLLWQEAFGDTKSFIQTFFETAFDYNRCFCAVDRGVITAALYWFDCIYQNKPVAYLYAIATSKAYQGQGICHRLMEHTHRYLQHHGYIGAVLVPGNTGLFEFYQGMGYKTCCFVNTTSLSASMPPAGDLPHPLCALPTDTRLIQATYSRCHLDEASDASFQLKPVTKDEYAALRRQLLPKDGIIQENICLDFLELQAKLYAGADFIMAAHKEEQKLFVPELLGTNINPRQILSALDCTEGVFRTPGTEKPFAMYLPLSENLLPLPAYFGLAFD